ncbi:hypothetical protein JST97_09455 [bacterium]|nr:hypothetical protein [bacterium]
MHRALLLTWLLYRTCSGQTLGQEKEMRSVLDNLFRGRPAAQQQIDWSALEVRKAPDLPHYGQLSATQQAAFRKAFLVTMAGQHPQLQGLRPRRQGSHYFLGRFRFRKDPSGFKLTGIL